MALLVAPRRLKSRFLVPGAVACAMLIGSVSAHGAPVTWGTCADVRQPVQCTSIEVPLDYSHHLTGHLHLRVAREITGIDRPWLVYLSGGPGAAGIPSFFRGHVDSLKPQLDSLKELTSRFNFLVFDQRGTGGSGALDCPKLQADGPSRANIEDCIHHLGPQRAFYTTRDSVKDLEQIRQMLGLDHLTLFGVSYGTKLALEYAAVHRSHVANLLLDGVVDPSNLDPLQLDLFRALRSSVRRLCPEQCAGVSKAPVHTLARLIDQLNVKKLQAHVFTGSRKSVLESLSDIDIHSLLLEGDYSPALRAITPAAAVAALRYDSPEALLRLKLLWNRKNLPEIESIPVFQSSDARFLAKCEETPVPWTPRSAGEQERKAGYRQELSTVDPEAFLPFSRLFVSDKSGVTFCLPWPMTRYPDVLPAFKYPHIPALLIQGKEDTRTPPEISRLVAAEIPGAQRVVIPGAGHGTGLLDSPCAQTQLDRFLAGETVQAKCPPIPTGIIPTEVPPRKFGNLKPVKGFSPEVGRTLTAIKLTLVDALNIITVAQTLGRQDAGGLFGGTVSSVNTNVTRILSDYQYISGVAVSTKLTRILPGIYASTTVLVEGKKAIAGSLSAQIDAKRNVVSLSGKLGDQAIPKLELQVSP